MVFLNIDNIVIIIDSCGKFQPAQMNFVEFHIYVHNTYNNHQRALIQKVYSKSCYVKLSKRLHLANYDITISR